MDELKAWHHLSETLASLGSVVIGYSGGVDSGLLCAAAVRVLGREKMRAILVDSASLARRELVMAQNFAHQQGFECIVVEGRELSDPEYVRNGADRCYFCKSDLSTHLLEAKQHYGFHHAAYGENADDGRDFRPGIRAAREKGVKAPLAEAGLTKQDVRALARHLGLSLWDKPAMPCLSSRIPYGVPVTAESLRRVDAAETLLADLGFRDFRVRMEKEGARIEMARPEQDRLTGPGIWERVETSLRAMGFPKVWLDPLGLQSGNLNARLNETEKLKARAG